MSASKEHERGKATVIAALAALPVLIDYEKSIVSQSKMSDAEKGEHKTKADAAQNEAVGLKDPVFQNTIKRMMVCCTIKRERFNTQERLYVKTRAYRRRTSLPVPQLCKICFSKLLSVYGVCLESWKVPRLKSAHY